MSKKPQTKTETGWDDPKESQRFLDEAKAAEASDDPKDFDEAFKVLTKHSPKAKGAT